MAIYLNIDGLKGEVTAKGHENWIECSNMHWGVGRGIATPTGSSSNRETSAPSISEVTLTKIMDKSSADLFKEACAGQAKKVKIDLVQTAADNLAPFAKYELEQCLISGYSINSDGHGRPTESISLNFTKVKMEYIEFDNDHKVAGTFTSGYDVAKGSKF